MKIRIYKLMALTMTTALATSVAAQRGSLDTTFGNRGKVITPIGTSSDDCNNVAIQSDGKIILVGSSRVDAQGYEDLAIARFKTDGSLDSSFGLNGKVTTNYGGGGFVARTVKVQSNGKIVVAGGVNKLPYEFAVLRYNANGSLDSSFNSDGIFSMSVGPGPDAAKQVYIETDGKILAVGYSNGNKDAAMLRLKSNGTVDSTFAVNGIAIIPDFIVYGIARQSDGKIMITGALNTSSDVDYAAIRIKTDGTADSSFGTNGRIQTNISSNGDYPYAVAVQNDGKILIGGSSRKGANDDYVSIARYKSDGRIDSSFSEDGVDMRQLGVSYSYYSAIGVLTDGRIIAAGSSDDSSYYEKFTLICYNTDGSIDTTFGDHGIAKTSLSNSTNELTGLTIQTDGKILAIGSTYIGGSYDFSMVRYNYPPIVNGVKKVLTATREISVYPNPTSVYTVVETKKALNNADLVIYNAAGCAVRKMENISGNTVLLHREKLPAGLYYLHISENSGPASVMKLIIAD